MGQLERYGLFVLCLVIVLILGVAIWGGDPATPNTPGLGLAATVGGSTGEAQSPNATPPYGSGAGPRGDYSGDGRSGESGFFAHTRDEVDRAPANNGAGDGLQGLASVSPADNANRPAPPGRGERRQAKQVPVPRTAPAARTYKVRRGDTMGTIARKMLGSSKRVGEIRKLNPNVDPMLMQVDTVLRLPPMDAVAKRGARRTSNAKKGWRKYTVQAGDSPYSISIAMYGTHQYAKRIMQANGITDPQKMRAKSVLKIPPVE